MDITFQGIGKLFKFLFIWLFKDRRKELPYNKVVIGTYKTESLFVDIRSRVILEEQSRPDVGIFLDRIDIGKPFCPNCSRPLETTHLDWVADFAQIGYKCENCEIAHEGNKKSLIDDVIGEVRRNFEDYYSVYIQKIEKLTKGENRKYKLKN